MRTLAALALAALAARPAWGAFGTSARATTTAGFLQLGVGGRAVAMGEAYTALADGADSLYWNPAGLSRIKGRDATFMHAAYLGSSSYDYGAYAQNVGESGALGLGLQYFSAGSLTQTDETGTDMGSFSPYDLAASAGYANTFDGRPWAGLSGWSAGLAGKFIKSRILSSAQTGALDLGALSPAYLGGRLRLAMAAANIGGKMKFDAESEDLPTTFKLGGAYQLSEGWLASTDLGFPRNNQPFVAVGTEYWLVSAGPWRLAGRAGFNSKTLSSVDGLTGVSFGIGIGYDGASLDYGFVPVGSLGMAHRVSLSMKWGKTEGKPEYNIEAPKYPILLMQ